MPEAPDRHLVVVPHTHWDREWYRTHEEFRSRLVRILDELLELLEGDPEFRHFTLDGQVIAVDDYLEVRPRARERIAKLVGEGRLLVGPWYVLPDEWLVSGEALIRNLRTGLARAACLGGGMPVGYVPDQFGHVGQLPQIFAGFGFEGALLWRGVGRDVEETAFWWEAPDGTRLFSVYLVRGYGNAVHLPLDPAQLCERLTEEASQLKRYSRIRSLLLMNGSDHAAAQAGLPRALEEAARRMSDASVEIGTLPGFVRRAREEAADELAVHRGEFRSGLRAPLLPGCASARAQQKRADFRNDRLLTRYLEPLAAWLSALGGEPDLEMIDHAWRVALQNHPHDSICGCSIDRVHEQMQSRFQRVEEIATSQLERVTAELAARVRPAALAVANGKPASGGALPGLIAWNPHSSGVCEAVGEFDAFGVALRRGGGAPALHLRDAEGRRIPLHIDVVEPGAEVLSLVLPASFAATLVGGLGPDFLGSEVRALRWGPRAGRFEAELVLGRRALAVGALEADKRELSRVLRERGDDPVHFVARRLARLRARFSDALPGHGLRVYRVAKGRARGEGAEPLRAERRPDGGAVIENGYWRVEAAPDGSISLQASDGSRIDDALRLVSEGDRGDEYNFDPVPGATIVERPSRARVRLGSCSEAQAELCVDARYRVPEALAPHRDSRSRRCVSLPVKLSLRLLPGLDRVDVCVALDNSARDQRLRLLLRAPFGARRFEVESAFEVVERPIAPPRDAFGSAGPAEIPIGACPQRGFASLDDGRRGFSVANRGVAEVEAVAEPDGTTSLALTLLRAVGWLSRGDLVLRPSPAGPPIETPGAQVPGPHRAEVSLRLHPCGESARTGEAHRFAIPALVFEGDELAAGPLADGSRLLEVEDPALIVSAIEPRPGASLVRVYNASGARRRVGVRWNGAGTSSLEAVDLRERRDRSLLTEGEGPSATLELRPWQIANLLTR